MATINIIENQNSGQIRLIQEDISDQLGNSNVVYSTTQNFISDTLQVFLNGLSLRANSDFIEVGNNSFRFINYDNRVLNTLNSSESTLAIKYLKRFTQTEEFQIVQEDISDQLGSNQITFLTNQSFLPKSLQVFLNGLNLRLDSDFFELDTDSFQLTNYTGDFLKILNSNASTMSVTYIKHYSQTFRGPNFLEAAKRRSFAGEFFTRSDLKNNNTFNNNIFIKDIFEEDISNQIIKGISTYYLSNKFREKTLNLFSNQKLLIKNQDYIEDSDDTIIILSPDVIINKNLIAKYIIK